MSTKFSFSAFILALLSLQTIASPQDSLSWNSHKRIHNSGNFSRPMWLANHSTTRYRPDHSENKWYIAIIVEKGQASLKTLPASMTAGFDYTSSLSSQPIHYDGHLNLPLISSLVSVFTLGLEYGHRNGSVFGLSAVSYESYQLAGSLTSSVAVELKYGYNFPVLRKLWLRPNVGINFMHMSARFDEQIDNHDQDLYIFDKTFPYSTTRGSRQILSAATNVGFQEDFTLAKLRLDLIYGLTKFLFLTAGAGYCWTINHSESAEIYNKSTVSTLPFDATGFDFKTTVPPGNVFSASGLSYCLGINLRIGKK